MGVICKVKLNDKDWEAVDKYYFDNELRLVALLPSHVFRDCSQAKGSVIHIPGATMHFISQYPLKPEI